jgi:hypothetical protein
MEAWAAAPGLSEWMRQQQQLWQEQRLPERRAAQLLALGVPQPQNYMVTNRQSAYV